MKVNWENATIEKDPLGRGWDVVAAVTNILGFSGYCGFLHIGFTTKEHCEKFLNEEVLNNIDRS